MIYLIIGPSCAGKTSFTKNSFIKGQELTEHKDLIKYTECDSCILFGSYLQEKRMLGTDTIPRNFTNRIPEQLKKFIDAGVTKDIILDGNRIAFKTVFAKILEAAPKDQIKLFCITTSPEISYERNLQNNTKSSFSHLKGVRTRTLNVYFEYCDKMNGELIDTSLVTDFSSFGIDNLPKQPESFDLWAT